MHNINNQQNICSSAVFTNFDWDIIKMQLFMLAQSHIDNDFCVEFNINYINKCFQIIC